METIAKTATISECGLYRYTLSRAWDPSLDTLCWVMLNPSTADADQDDPTIRRVTSFTRAAGFGGFVVVNLFAYRATDPKVMLAASDAIGPDNNDHIGCQAFTRRVVVAWGATPKIGGRVCRVLDLLNSVGCRPECLGVTKSGAPRHPLFVRADTALTQFVTRQL